MLPFDWFIYVACAIIYDYQASAIIVYKCVPLISRITWKIFLDFNASFFTVLSAYGMNSGIILYVIHESAEKVGTVFII